MYEYATVAMQPFFIGGSATIVIDFNYLLGYY